jgi:hypothetical protein
MSNAESMASKNLEKANKFYSIGMKNIKVQMKLMGTEFVVLRPKNDKWRNVFGGSYSSDTTLENDYEQFTTTLIINMNDMRDVWNRNRDTIESYTPDDSLQVGDELQYTRDKRTYRFKISMKQAYSEAAETLFAYTLSSIIETIEE